MSAPQQVADAWNLINQCLAAGKGKSMQEYAENGVCVLADVLRDVEARQ